LVHARTVIDRGCTDKENAVAVSLPPLNHIGAMLNELSLEEPPRGEEGIEERLLLGEVLASNEEDPSVTGARNLDWQAGRGEKALLAVSQSASGPTLLLRRF
jgi:hypothetical protein